MWALQLYIVFFPNFHSPFREPTTSIFRTVFSHGISIPPPTSWLSLGHFSSRAPGAPFFHIMARYARVLSHLSNTCSYFLFSSDIVHFGYLVVLCAGTWSSSRHTRPSGIYSALACSLSHCTAFTFPVTPSDIGLQDPYSRLCSTHTSIYIFSTVIRQHSHPHELSHSQHLLALLTLMLFFITLLGMGVPIVFHHVANQPHTSSPHFASFPQGLPDHRFMVMFFFLPAPQQDHEPTISSTISLPIYEPISISPTSYRNPPMGLPPFISFS